MPGGDDSSFIMDYMIYLRDTRKYSSRTVNLCGAAIKFFYREVIRAQPENIKVQTMKTGRSLPKPASPERPEARNQRPAGTADKLVVYNIRICYDFS